MALTPIPLTLIPMGPVKAPVLKHIAIEMDTLGFRVRIGDEMPVPEGSYHKSRRQYLARDFIKALKTSMKGRVLGVTEVDLYTPDLNFVLGQAQLPGRCAVISLHRLSWDINHRGFLDRCVKEAVHEVGHTLGLRHCDDYLCVMHFSNSLRDTDWKGMVWCDECADRLGKLT